MFVARSVESEQVDENCRTFSIDELSESDSGVMRRLWGSKEASSCLLQDLQSEIETHRDVYASLNGTGRKLLSSLASQDDAVMLQRRLDEMNQRWHHLKAKSMAISNMRGNTHSISSIQKHLQARHSVKDINNVVNKSVALFDISFRHPVFARLQLTGLGYVGLYRVDNIMNLNEHTMMRRIQCRGIHFSSEHQSPIILILILNINNYYWNRMLIAVIVLIRYFCKIILSVNRLESNTEHWNALLLSLRELIEWVIRKDTELTGLGPVCGDVAALQKQQASVLQLCLYDRRQLIRNTDIYVFSSRLSVPSHGNVINYVIAPFPVSEELNAKRKLGTAPDDDHRGFRRQLEDKRPVVENNLLSGRQYIANEPPLSDTSDSEAGRELDGDSRGYRSAEEQARELTRSIRREVNKLSEQWNALIERSDAWKRKLDDTANLRCVPDQSTLVSHLMPPKSRARVFFDIGNSSYFRDESGEKTRSNIQRGKSVEQLHQRMHSSSLMQTLRSTGSCIRPRTKKSFALQQVPLRRNRL
ncbi:Dystrophin, isoform D [Trachymyrmex septentrionalis]|uniref:Dystrophin, isoform D n=1 Tax=Trachymyrmex septentrionalis TaxID=34720 RepID=A0A195EZG1_9HYME|nr:Dystrophin, isoform D [Trachymyrmex septentrionalis]